MHQTEIRIVEAFAQLLDEKPLGKITVKNIVDQCGINRNTFYYHFADIPALIERTIKEWADQSIQSNQGFRTPSDCIVPIARFGEEHKQMLLRIYRSTHREVVQEYLNRAALYTVARYIDLADPGAKLTEEERGLLTRYYKCMLVGCLLDWLDAGMSYDLLGEMQRLEALLEGPMQDILVKE